MHRHTLKFSILGAAFIALCLPMLAFAQVAIQITAGIRITTLSGLRRNGRYDQRYLKDSITGLIGWRRIFRRILIERWIAVAETAASLRIS